MDIMMNIRWLTTLFMAAMFWAGGALAEGNALHGRQLAAGCAACHGDDGNGNAPIFPKLAGQHAGYLAKQLHDFKSGARPETTMSAMAAPLSDADIMDLAAWYAGQTVRVEKTEGNREGERLFQIGSIDQKIPACSACHGPEGRGHAAAGFPDLHGQYSAYIDKTLGDYKTGDRHNDRNEMMRMIASRLSEDQIKAVADYLAGLR